MAKRIQQTMLVGSPGSYRWRSMGIVLRFTHCRPSDAELPFPQQHHARQTFHTILPADWLPTCLGAASHARHITAGRTCEEKEAIAWGDNGRLKTGGECRHARKGRRTPLCMENMARGAMRIGISLCRQKIRCGVYTAHGSA